MLNRLDAQSRRDVAFACAWSADQYDVVGAIHKVTTVKFTHEGLVDLTDGQVEACQMRIPDDAASRVQRRLAHFRANRDELQKAMKSQEKNLDREFLGRRITKAVKPWRTP